MTAATQPFWTTVRNRKLSLWQSAAERMLARQPPDGSPALLTRGARLAHPVMQGVQQHIRAIAGGQRVPAPAAALRATAGDPSVHAYLSQLHLDRAEATRIGDGVKAAALDSECRQYATCHTIGWIGCEADWLESLRPGGVEYVDWTKRPDPERPGKLLSADPNFGVADWKLPNDATVALLGDWGTGLPDARALVQELMMLTPRPQAIVHIGDIYYGGTPDECGHNFLDVLAAAAPGVPVLTIPGNHEYYSAGTGFYPMLAQLNPGLPRMQAASYFSLRTADGLWQLLGGDTGQDDTQPLDGSLFAPEEPKLRATEVTWHADKMTRDFHGSTLFFTHHQLFTANDPITSDRTQPPYVNMKLGAQLAPYFPNIAAWFWGHEHDLAIFQNGLCGLAMGRLVGSSAFEEATADVPYGVRFPQVPFDASIEPPASNGYYPHACALFDFKRTQPTDPIRVTYYATPAWYETPPSPLPGLTPLLTETIAPAATARAAASRGRL